MKKIEITKWVIEHEVAKGKARLVAFDKSGNRYKFSIYVDIFSRLPLDITFEESPRKKPQHE